MTQSLMAGGMIALAIILGGCASDADVSADGPPAEEPAASPTPALADLVAVELSECEATDGNNVLGVTNNSGMLVGVYFQLGLYDQAGVRVDYDEYEVPVPADTTTREELDLFSIQTEAGQTCRLDSLEVIAGE